MSYPQYRFKTTASADYYIIDISASRQINIKLPLLGVPTTNENTIGGGDEILESLYTTVRKEYDDYLKVGDRPPHAPS